jgi:hypothetical protein
MLIRFLLTMLFLAAVVPASQAEVKKITIYADGVSCPANCDAHVVFNESMNGTEFAHKPGTKYSDCVEDEECRICFESGEKQCLMVMYRGGGPKPNTFDFTPAFYQKACASTPAQPLLAKECVSLKESAKALDGRINCLATPENPKCTAIIAAAKAARELDIPNYKKCLQMTEDAYNKVVQVAEQRDNDCTYEKNGTGKNSKGLTWRKLLPAACREGTYVGRDGLDCCSGNTFADGPLGRECRGFYPVP